MTGGTSVPGAMTGERLQKVLARAGVGSRRRAEELIAAGRVKVDGRTARLGQRIDPSTAKVEVDGSLVPLDTALVYYMLNKPAGYVTTASDPQGRPTVLELVDPAQRVWPVGRLDIATEGLLLLTNDGPLTHALTHPSRAVPRTYLAEVAGAVKPAVVKALIRGVELDDGPARPERVTEIDRTPHATLFEVVVTEGRNRLVRRLFDTVGHPVRRLVRVGQGPVRLGRLKPGTLRRLSPGEVRALYRAAGL